MKKVIYTALIGRHDNYREPEHMNDGFDYILFTDQNIKSNYHKVIKVPVLFNSPVRTARQIKVMAHHYLRDYDMSVWHDANIVQIADIEPLINFDTVDLITLAHPHRDCIYTEAEACIRLRKDSSFIIKNHINKYKKDNYPVGNGLIAAGVVTRKHTLNINMFNTLWWNELLNGSHRDQLSFNYIAKKMRLKYDTIPFDTIQGKYFQIHKHNKIK